MLVILIYQEKDEWFIYFLESKKKIPAFIFFFLAITAKENIALLTFLISGVFFIKERSKLLIFFMLASLTYLLFIFSIYFPYIAQVNYLYANNHGLLSNFNPYSLIDSPAKREVIWYSFLSFGFLPLLSPLYLLPVLGHFGTFFVIASDLSGSHGLYMHYRVTLAPLLIWATIATIAKLKRVQTWHLAVYILFFTALTQYVLHLPLSYLSKEWFWTEPSGVKNINLLKNHLPHDASMVAQNNIVPHVSHREKIYSLYPEMKHFDNDSPCKENQCHWFRWHDNPEFLFIDTSPEWDIRHLLSNREDFIKGIKNLEKMKIITKYKQTGNAVLYKVNKNPSEL